MEMKLREVYHGKFWRHGATWGITIPYDLREAMSLNPGDHVLMNFSHGILWVVRATPELVIPRKHVVAILDKLFPGKAAENGTDG